MILHGFCKIYNKCLDGTVARQADNRRQVAEAECRPTYVTEGNQMLHVPWSIAHYYIVLRLRRVSLWLRSLHTVMSSASEQ